MQKGNFINRIGEKHITNQGYEIEIIECSGAHNCTIKFEDGNIIKNREYSNIIKGTINNPYHRSVSSVGFIGEGEYSNKLYPEAYQSWASMLKRCYVKKTQDNHLTYIGCLVDERWHNFQVFAKWFKEKRKFWMDDYWQLDKDILIKGNKIYSPETCCFVPHIINSLFTKSNTTRGEYPIGVSKRGEKFRASLHVNNSLLNLGTFNTVEEAFQAYKTAKELRIKELANKWKPQLDIKTYNALINYKVEITD